MSSFTIFTDGGSRNNPGPAAIGVSVVDDQGKEVSTVSQYIGIGTNNEAEYKAFLSSLEWVSQHMAEITEIVWKLDSQLVVQQLQGNWKVKEARLQNFVLQAQSFLKTFNKTYSIMYVPRAENARADELVNQALDAQMVSTVH